MRYLIHALGHEGEVISPTFMLLQEYPITTADGTGTTLYHMDAYRIEQPEECEEIGLPELLENGILCVEWPQNCADWLPKDALQLTLDATNEKRTAQLISPKRPEEAERIAKAFHDLSTSR